MQISGGILFAAAAAVAAASAALRLGGLALGLDACFIGMERALGDVAESGDALVYHVPQAHGQVVAVAAVDGHAFEAVAVMAAGLLAGAVVAGLTHLTQEFQLEFKRLVLKALLVELILKDGKFISVDFHSDTPHFLSGVARKRNGGAVLCISRIAEKEVISNHATVGIYYWKRGSDYVKYAENMILKNRL